LHNWNSGLQVLKYWPTDLQGEAMSAGEYCNREVVVVEKSESIREAVNLMRSHHVGDVVVVEKRDESPVPIGVLTDRDIVLEVLAQDVDIDAVNIGDVMSDTLITIKENTKLLDALALMKDKGIRRVPVIDGQDNLVGILTVDDILELVAEQVTNITQLIANEQSRESRRRH
jgi:CBS domain-containing protein